MMQCTVCFCIYLKLKLLHAYCCISLCSTIKVSSGDDEMALEGVEVAPGTFLNMPAGKHRNLHKQQQMEEECLLTEKFTEQKEA